MSKTDFIFIFAEDNLQQLKNIQDQIQKMRVENQKQAAADLSYPMSSNSKTGLINLGANMSRDQYAAARLSSSCPSLNNGLSIGTERNGGLPMSENDNYLNQGCNFDMNSNYNSSQTPAGPASVAPGHASRRRKNNDPNNPSGGGVPSGGGLTVPGNKSHRKRQGHHRQRR